MLIVKVKNGKIEGALKQLKKKMRQSKQNKELNKRREFTKKSIERRDEISKAIHKQRKQIEDEY